MVLQRMQNQESGSILSVDANLRLKWTSELHQRFVQAVIQLGGADRATPKTLKRVMGIPELTLYHLKSHLQKYRIGKKQESEVCGDDSVDIYEAHYGNGPMIGGHNLQIAHALELQMEVKSKHEEQIEVQRHLQLRIDTQRKYLDSLLKKAH
ncbi:hypothetical protein L1049_028253 [Liquidambar formosana]|uniref:HTH myb-type domain-containing protein n=1 Tax=Liquidambar formosana TaxID=63359 RepID=A0AAP0WT48_LIQFO